LQCRQSKIQRGLKDVAKEKPANDVPIEKEEAKTGSDRFGFFRDSKAELAKVIWPNRQQLVSESLAVVLMVSLSAGVIYGVNNLFSWVAEIVFKTPAA
jgi:preprotein translocase subunit SecE